MICSVKGCQRKRRAYRLCNMHRQRLENHGDPLARLRNANGEGHTRLNGYRSIQINGKAFNQNRLDAEAAIGKPLPRVAEVVPTCGALVVSPGKGYTKLLHTRLKALKATGDPNKRQCRYCKGWDERTNLYIKDGHEKGEHSACRQNMRRQKYAMRKMVKLLRPTGNPMPLRWAA